MNNSFVLSWFSSGFTLASRLIRLCTDLRTQPVTSGPDTIIVGAGIIGLCIAYQLALAEKKLGRKRTITVLEAHDEVFAAASSQNTAAGAC
jgi:threonine dehydrogenase-like Zn-dependent dehydrogenase